MIKRYCDFCQGEITKRNEFPSSGLFNSIHTKDKSIKVNIQILVASTEDTPDCCRYCIIDSVKRLDDRPKSKQ